MNAKAQQRAIAAAVGITNIRPDPNGWGGGPDAQYVGESTKPFVGWMCCHTKIPRYSGRLPKYTDDLNAMHEAEATLTPEQKRAYADMLAAYYLPDAIDESTAYAIAIGSPAAQRAEAFLKTLNLWQDEA